MPLNLIAAIADCFPDSPMPQEHDLLYAGAYVGDPELDQIRQFFTSRTWRSLTPDEIFRFRHALSFFSSKAFRYYVAAWMTCSLLDVEAVDTAVGDLVFQLQKMKPTDFTAAQRRAICEWLDYFTPRDGSDSDVEFQRTRTNYSVDHQ